MDTSSGFSQRANTQPPRPPSDAQNDSDTQVVDYMVARYGEFVLLRPRMSWHTAILWAAPLTILIIGMFAIGFSVLRRSARPGLPEIAALTEGEKRKLNAIDSQLDGA